ncbi:helix-turn-helix transcriptional regulator [Candidatus Falkowbacteria bacterium]|nr:helix-turn-helix transcriptional regulator [Candidatus Falkowbacteria bacterium]
MKKIANNIKLLRHQQGMSQEDLAHKAGLKISNLAKLEGGFNCNPTFRTLLALAKVLTKNSVDNLINLKKNKKK